MTEAVVDMACNYTRPIGKHPLGYFDQSQMDAMAELMQWVVVSSGHNIPALKDHIIKTIDPSYYEEYTSKGKSAIDPPRLDMWEVRKEFPRLRDGIRAFEDMFNEWGVRE